ncbi:MAG: murein biosynthesis integral membrane protein MurJ [Paeniclostridium sp.]|nr:murein biosynthesis integral membrane protein MurJ [Paeniclostridium sp.]MBW4861656.1 murein biosynthesis integral membrane protein MurJ [Paeniclostridium sp.]MBW4875092.1 murein biosynthesis integral membrane protein MurJ [Paeniclostridium sp.]
MSNAVKATLGLALVTILSKFLGFGRELALTYVHGASAYSDAYITAVSIPLVLFSSIGTAIGTTFIPLFYEVSKSEGDRKSLDFTNNIINIVLLIGMLISILGFKFAEPLVKIFAMNFSGEKLEVTVIFTKIMISGVMFIGISQIMTSWLQLNDKFIIPGMIGFPYNIIAIFSILLSSKGNINIMAIGTLIGTISQFLFQLPFAIKSNFRYKAYINLKDKHIKKMLWLIIPVFIGVGVNQLNNIVDRSLASTLGDGIITILNSANRLNNFVIGLFIATIAAVVYPTFSKLSNEGNKAKFIESITQSINIVIILIIPVSIGAIVLANPVVRIVFERGAFDSNATSMTAIALACYSIGMIGVGLREILNRVFFSLKDTRTPMINGALSMIINILLNIILIKFLGCAGLAFATSLASLICILLLFRSLNKKIGYYGQDKIIETIIKSLASAIIMSVFIIIIFKLVTNFLGIGFIKDIISLGAATAIGAIVYIVLVIKLKVEEINIITNRIKLKICRCKESDVI